MTDEKVNIHDPFWQSQGAEIVEPEVVEGSRQNIAKKKIEARVAAEKGKNNDTQGGKELDWVPWVSAGGTGLIAHALASSLFDDDDKEKNKSVWYRLLKTLIPLGAGAAGAYGGYRLADSMKTAAEKPRGIRVRPGDGFSYVIPETHAPTYQSIVEWGRSDGRPSSDPLPEIADDAETWERRKGYGWQIGSPILGTAGTLYFGNRALRELFPTGEGSSLTVPRYSAEDIQKARDTLAQRDAASAPVPEPPQPPTLDAAQRLAYEQELAKLQEAVGKGQLLPEEAQAAAAEISKIKTEAAANADYWKSRVRYLTEELKLPKDNRKVIEALDSLHREDVRATNPGIRTTPTSAQIRDYSRRIGEIKNKLNPPTPPPPARPAMPAQAAIDSAEAIMKNPKARNWNWRGYGKGLWNNGFFRDSALTGASIAGGIGGYLYGSHKLRNASEMREIMDFLDETKSELPTQPIQPTHGTPTANQAPTSR